MVLIPVETIQIQNENCLIGHELLERSGKVIVTKVGNVNGEIAIQKEIWIEVSMPLVVGDGRDVE